MVTREVPRDLAQPVYKTVLWGNISQSHISGWPANTSCLRMLIFCAPFMERKKGISHSHCSEWIVFIVCLLFWAVLQVYYSCYFSISLDIIKVILTKIIVSFFTTRSPVFIAIFILPVQSHLSIIVSDHKHRWCCMDIYLKCFISNYLVISNSHQGT